VALTGSRRGDGGAVVQNPGNEMAKMNRQTMAGQADAGTIVLLRIRNASPGAGAKFVWPHR